MEKIKLVIPDEKLRDFSQFKRLKLNVNGRKPRGKNYYKKQLARVRRLLR